MSTYGTQQLFGVPLGYLEGANPSIRFPLFVDYASASGLKARSVDGGTLWLAPSTDAPTRDALVTMSLANAAGREWRVIRLGGVRLTQAKLDSGAWALVVVDAADASAANYRAVTVDGGTLTTVFTGTGDYRALLVDAAADVSANPVVRNVFGGLVAFNSTNGGSALLGGGVAVPANTVAPSISATSTIGTQISGDDGTWTNPQSYTYQWQRNTGSWVDIGSATNKNYTPVDADFGYALRLVVTTGGVSANSNSTNLTQEAPAQTLGSERITNGTLAGGLTGWSASGTPTTLEVSSGRLHVITDAASEGAVQSSVYTNLAGQFFEFGLDAEITSGGLQVLLQGGSTPLNIAYSGNATRRVLLRETTTNSRNLLLWGTTTSEFYADNLTLKSATINTELVAPSANMRISQFYTLPASPAQGDALWLMPRISDFATGNYWLGLLEYTGSQWNITLYSVATHTRTARIATVTNIGTSNGIRITANGSDWTLETTANSGSNWTSRGTVNNSTYSTATGANVVATSTFTLGLLQYEAA